MEPGTTQYRIVGIDAGDIEPDELVRCNMLEQAMEELDRTRRDTDPPYDEVRIEMREVSKWQPLMDRPLTDGEHYERFGYC